MTSWTNGEITVVAGAVLRAPSVHNTQPWVLEFHGGSVSLFERLDLSLQQHDPTGRDRLISCGAALTNLVVAVRILGWDTRILLFPEAVHPDEVARVTATDRREPSDVDLARYAAIPWRHSHRAPFAATPVPAELRHELVVASTDGVQVRPVTGLAESTVLATLLDHTGLAIRGDRGYQRELAVWTNTRPDHRPGGGLPAPRPFYDTLPWVGLVRNTTCLPDVNTLSARLSRECLLLLQTPDDGLANHVLAGQAVQQVWLTATRYGLAGSVLTQPLQVPEVRAGLIEQLSLAGFPQALLRLGYPVDAAPLSPRIPIHDLIRPETSRP